MFSLSLLPTAHHCLFKQTSVRSSTWFYPSFNLAMGRSPGFGSTARNSVALFRLGFPPAPALPCLNLAAYSNSQAHSTKGTPSPIRRQALTACRSTVSGSVSLPSRGAFAIGSYLVFSLGGWSPQIPAGFLVSRRTQVRLRSLLAFAYRTFTFFGRPSQCRSANKKVSYSKGDALQPPHRRNDMGLGCSPSARRY